MKSIKINKKVISEKHPTYFIADISANHDGSLNKAKELIHMASEAGANAAKFQNFFAKTIVSDVGFRKLKKKFSHQKSWKKSVYQVYKKAELPIEWTGELNQTCKKYKIDYFTAPYDYNLINYLNKFVCAWKVGSGDINWHESILQMAKTKKPILIATGASNLSEVKNTINKVKKFNDKIVLMQCNTNYTASKKNFSYINLNVLKSFKKTFNNCILGLSDHTFGHETVLGAISLGARVIEKHFTDDNRRIGPDHKFSMNPKTWRSMIDASRNLENALGNGIKIIEQNEKDTVILQRRAIRVNREIKKGEYIKKNDLICLRPCPKGSIEPYDIKKIINKRAKKTLYYHQHLTPKDII